MSLFTIKNPTFAKQLEEKTKDDPVMKEFLCSIIENSYETSQYKKKYSDAIEKAIVQIKDGGEYEI